MDMSRISFQSLDVGHERPLFVVDIGLVVTFEVGETTPSLKCLEPMARATNCACFEEDGGFKMIHKCVPWSSNGLCSTPTTTF